VDCGPEMDCCGHACPLLLALHHSHAQHVQNDPSYGHLPVRDGGDGYFHFQPLSTPPSKWLVPYAIYTLLPLLMTRIIYLFNNYIVAVLPIFINLKEKGQKQYTLALGLPFMISFYYKPLLFQFHSLQTQ